MTSAVLAILAAAPVSGGAGMPAAPPAAAPAATAPAPAAAEHRAEIETWRREREARLRAPDGWLSLVGLDWLHAGANRFGSAPDDDVKLPAPVPPHAGTLFVDGVAVTVALAPAAAAPTRNGQPFTAAAGGRRVPLATDAQNARNDAKPDVLGWGTVTLQVIDRGGRLGARVKDAASPVRTRFAGLSFFPFAPEYRAIARLVPHASPKQLVVPDSSGGQQRLDSPGRLELTLLGHALALDPVRDGPDDGDLLVVFRDATTGRDTYGAGRFLRALRRGDGSWVLDFNRAYSPPCAFTPYATCPMPPPQNRVPFAIAAGEKAPAGHGR